MAFNNITISATTLKSVTSGLETAVNNQLAGILDKYIIGVDIVAKDKARKQGKELDVQVSYDGVSAGATLLTNPYQLITFLGTTLQDAASAAATWRAAHPGYFHAAPVFKYINQSGSRNKPFIIFQFYCQDANGIDNWLVNNNSKSIDSSGFNRALSVADNTAQKVSNKYNEDAVYIVSRPTIVTAVQNYDFSGLSLQCCQLLFNLRNDNAGSASYSVYINGDYTAGHYHRNQIFASNGTAPIGGEGGNTILETPVATGDTLMGKLVFMTGPGFLMIDVITHIVYDYTNHGTRIQNILYHDAPVATITDIRLAGSVADAIGVGSGLRLLNIG